MISCANDIYCHVYYTLAPMILYYNFYFRQLNLDTITIIADGLHFTLKITLLTLH